MDGLIFLQILTFLPAAQKRPKFERFKNRLQLVEVRLCQFPRFPIYVERHVRLDCRQKFRETDFLRIVFHLLALRPFQLVRMFEQVFNTSEALNQSSGRFGAHARTTRYVIGRITHQSQVVDDLFRICQPIFLANLFHAQNFPRRIAVSGPLHQHVRFYQLRIIFVGRDHSYLNTLCRSPFSHRSDHIISLEALHLDDRNIVSADNIFNDGHGALNILRCRFALRFIIRISLVAKRRTGRVKRNREHIGRFFAPNILKRINKTIDGRRIFSFRVDTRTTYEGIISPINKRVSVQ